MRPRHTNKNEALQSLQPGKSNRAPVLTGCIIRGTPTAHSPPAAPLQCWGDRRAKHKPERREHFSVCTQHLKGNLTASWKWQCGENNKTENLKKEILPVDLGVDSRAAA